MHQTRDPPLVAIFTPVYNGARFLEETMACVQAQTYPNLVHVVLDNCSTDATPEIINRYLGQRVPLLTGRNAETIPQYDNWEAAARMTPAEGRYFLLLCADDLIRADAIEKLVDVAESDPAIGVVGCQWTTGVDPDGSNELCRPGVPNKLSPFDTRWIVKAYLLKLHFATLRHSELSRS